MTTQRRHHRTPPHIPSLFDAPAAAVARDEAIQRAADHAAPQWKKSASRAIEELARTRLSFTTDDVWKFLHEHGEPMPHEPRALGAMMKAASNAGLIAASDRYVNSDRVSCHRRPVRVWISKVSSV